MQRWAFISHAQRTPLRPELATLRYGARGIGYYALLGGWAFISHTPDPGLQALGEILSQCMSACSALCGSLPLGDPQGHGRRWRSKHYKPPVSQTRFSGDGAANNVKYQADKHLGGRPSGRPGNRTAEGLDGLAAGQMAGPVARRLSDRAVNGRAGRPSGQTAGLQGS